MDNENNWLGWVVLGFIIWGGYSIFSEDSSSSYENGSSRDSARSYDYEEEYYDRPSTFNGYDCTDDCSGHEAGYEWAEDKGIYDESDCGGNSNSFIEGCVSFVEDNY